MLSRIVFLYSCVWLAMTDSGVDFGAWDRLLKRHVHLGAKGGIATTLVDYCGLKRDADFWQFLDSLATAKLAGLSKNEFYAVYINAYNAFAFEATLRGARTSVLQNHRCIKAMWPVGPDGRDGIPLVFKKVEHNFSGQLVALNDVEAMVRNPSSLGFREDCRVHGCLVCGGVSCPNVRREAFRPENLDAQMSDNMREWLAEPRKGAHVDADGRLSVSLIFKWFPDDFTACSGSVGAFLAEYAPKEVAAFIHAHGTGELPLSYFNYDKDLNGDAEALCNCSAELPVESIAEDPITVLYE